MSTGWIAPGSQPPSQDDPVPEDTQSPEGPATSTSPPAPGSGPRRELVQRVSLFPLRPLGLGEVFGAAVRIYRLQPKLTLGLSAVVYGAAFILITAVTGAGMIPFIGQMQAAVDDPLGNQAAGPVFSDALATVGSSLVTAMITLVAASVVTVALTRIALAEATGEASSSTQSIADVKRLALPAIGTSLILGVLGMLAFLLPSAAGSIPLILLQEATVWTIAPLLGGLLLGLLAVVWIWARTVLAIPSLSLEGVGMLTAIRRSFSLTQGRRLWRVLGIGLLLYALTMIISQAVASAFGVVAFVATMVVLLATAMDGVVLAMVLMTVITMVGSYLATVLISPFLSAGFATLYADQRMRHEAWDVELTRRARENWAGGSER